MLYLGFGWEALAALAHSLEKMLTTKTKIALAGLAYRAIAMSRGLVGKGKQVEVRRGGVRWCLDLNEGIDFSIYLLGAFEKSTAATLRSLVKPGDTVLDIGANVGAHTLGLAQSDWLKPCNVSRIAAAVRSGAAHSMYSVYHTACL